MLPYSACGGEKGSSDPGTIELVVPAFRGGVIPLAQVRTEAGGGNRSPVVQWSSVPKGTLSLALIFYDTHPIAREWIHWAVLDLPPGSAGLEEGSSGTSLPVGARELLNDFGQSGYGGPQPPVGSGLHRYRLILYALSVPTVALQGKTTKAAFEAAVRPSVLASAMLEAGYERK
ncbi:MAG: hypothetical protein A2284_07595 [Deltaproteobacteria bacterium RIFOXYA12_FULL_61_11]|nr:MAG: hypothetical protein A2284_07595 [Deltaproteobacteria bacterium RIFOXYA12_FULL_61_11]